MEINIRQWNRDDLPQIQSAWLDYCRNVGRSDMQLKTSAESAMKLWLTERFKEPGSMGFVAEKEGVVAGFLLGRLDDWESMPPVIEPRRIGIIDAVYVNQPFRKQGIGSQLIERAIQTMKDRNAIAVETTYEAWNETAARAWHRAGFAPWMVHAYRML